MDEYNPLGREYSPAEIAAAIRVGLAFRRTEVSGPPAALIKKRFVSGPLIYACGPYHVNSARAQAERSRKKAADYDTVADAMERELKKEADHESRHRDN